MPLMKRTVRDESGAWSLANIAPAPRDRHRDVGAARPSRWARVDSEDVAGPIDDGRGQRVVAERGGRNRQHRAHVVGRQDLRRGRPA